MIVLAVGENSEQYAFKAQLVTALKVQAPNNEELDAHAEYVAMLEKNTGHSGVWS